MRTPSRSLLVTCAAGLALAGCNFAPHYDPPKTDSAGAFKEAVPNTTPDPQGWKQAAPNDATLRGNWWELYNDRQLNDLEERVKISNQTVIAAEANYRVARALVGEAQANLFPSVTAAPSVIRSRSSASGGSGGSAPNNGTAAGGASSGGSSSTAGTPTEPSGNNTVPKTTYTLPFEATYEVDLWGSVRNSVRQARFTSESSAAAVQTAILTTQSTLAQDYFALRATDEQRRILDTTLADYEASLHLVRTLYNNGLAWRRTWRRPTPSWTARRPRPPTWG